MSRVRSCSPRSAILIAGVVLATLPSVAAATNLVVNPDFEGSTYTFNTGAITENLPSGWTLGPPASTTASDVNVTNATGSGLGPQNGSDYLRYQATSNELTGGGEDCVYQDIPTVAGQQYLLSYWVADTGTNTSNIDFRAVWAENLPSQVTHLYSVPANPTAYQSFSFIETATSTTTRLDFHGEDPSGSILLDNVSLTPVPEPATLWLFLMAGAIAAVAVAPTRRQESRPR
jgi:hypothetical protein